MHIHLSRSIYLYIYQFPRLVFGSISLSLYLYLSVFCHILLSPYILLPLSLSIYISLVFSLSLSLSLSRFLPLYLSFLLSMYQSALFILLLFILSCSLSLSSSVSAVTSSCGECGWLKGMSAVSELAAESLQGKPRADVSTAPLVSSIHEALRGWPTCNKKTSCRQSQERCRQ